MKNTQDKWFERLKDMAEQAVKNQSGDVENIDSADIAKLINDIQVFQAELEIQNDELRTSLDELEKSRTRFSRLFDMAPAGYIILDASGIVLDLNQTMMDMLHKTRDDLMRKPFSRFIIPDDQGIFTARFTAFYKNPADKTMEIRLVKGRNSMFHARLEGRFISFETVPGKPDIDQFCLIVSDISETKKAENELKNYARTLNERNKELHCLYSISRLINDPAKSMDDYFNQTISILVNAMQYPERVSGRIKYKNQQYTTQIFTETEWKQASDIVVNDDIIGCVEIYYVDKMPIIHNSPFLEEEASLINAVAMRLGQTIARKQAEQHEKRTRRYLETILQTTADGFWVLDMHGILIDVNDAYCRMTGYTKDQILGMSIGDLDDMILGMSIGDLDDIESPEVTAERIERIIANGSEFFETRQRRQDGSVFPVEVSTTWLPIDEGRLVCFGRDITERKKMEKQLLQVEKGESLSRMAGAVAHHFNNILMITIGYLDMVQGDIPQGSETANSIKEAATAAQRAVVLSQLMLTYLGQGVRKNEKIDLSELCRGKMKALSKAMPENISLTTRFAFTGLIVQSDRSHLEQVLNILFENAVEALVEETSGKISVTLEPAETSDIQYVHMFPNNWQAGPETYAQLIFSDTGKGMAEETIPLIFDPFYSDKFTGRGMGMKFKDDYPNHEY
ncbi:MAG: PAS domain S-box protein [Desulfobacteraceae bacterium]|nr:PAS domain S-box protein [Desulfobacteraceae bacterium]